MYAPPLTSQSPAVREMDARLVIVAVVIATDVAVADTYSPKYPVGALVPLVTPEMLGRNKKGELCRTKSPLPVAAFVLVPPLAIETRPESCAAGIDVAFERLTAEGVPRFGVVRVGDVERTIEPLPVGADPRAVARPVPRPVMPVLTGSPVAFVKVNAEGVPNAGEVSVGDDDNTRLPEPVAFVVRAALTPVPRPVNELEGNPVAFVRVRDEGVPRLAPLGTVTVPVKLGDATGAYGASREVRAEPEIVPVMVGLAIVGALFSTSMPEPLALFAPVPPLEIAKGLVSVKLLKIGDG
jgi:hypothetical protein